MTKILITDDDVRICELISKYLEKNNFKSSIANNAKQAEKLLDKESFDLMILDIMMPDMNGFDFAQQLREQENNIPILFLSAKVETEDKIKGLEIGADDYLTKPFEPKELILRINAILKRQKSSKETLSFGPYELNESDMILYNKEKNYKIYLNAIETNFLRVLIKANEAPVSRNELIEKSRVIVEFRTIDVQIMRLRAKIEQDPKNPKYLQTIRNKGYILKR